ncbi:hypothetical protein CTI12_AA029620 [Artemisia annua]|uniref:Uncharacterized protein n=1 Tax=Artemisia annua TaxID=35608 RepID=A0A2U1QDC4_ARTAN|nr:hypothetical protein CTI12_AA029620 [Artemisia annua]
MEDHMHDEDDTLSLSDLRIEDDTTNSQEQDFLGFFSEEWSRDQSCNTSPENIIFCGKQFSSKSSVARDKTSQLFRSNYDSFRFMSMKNRSRPSTPRCKSLPTRLTPSSSCKSKWHVFMFGFGSGKFPTTMDMSDIKNRQLRRSIDDGEEESGVRRSGNKGWWRLVDVLGCGTGYERDTIVVTD